MGKIRDIQATTSTNFEEQALATVAAFIKALPKKFKDLSDQQIKSLPNFEKLEYYSLRNKYFEHLAYPQRPAIPLDPPGAIDWQELVQDFKIRWFKIAKKYIEEKNILKQSIEKAAFASIAYDKRWLIGDESYNRKKRILMNDFCKSYFNKDVITLLASGKKKNLEKNKKDILYIFTITVPDLI